MKRIITIIIMIFHHSVIHEVNAQPDLTASFTEHNIVFIRDISQPHIYYYLPGKLAIGRLADGRPDLSFTMMRYMGSDVLGDNGEWRYKNILSMRVEMKKVPADSLNLAKSKLENHHPITVRPLPISMIDAMLVFVPIGEKDTMAVVQKGNLSAEGTSGYSTSGSFWQERYFTVFLDNHSANLLKEAFTKDYTAISFMYAFYARGVSKGKIASFSGYENLSSLFRNQLKKEVADSTGQFYECMVKSDAFSIYTDSLQQLDFIKQIDINDGVPPGYAILNVRNYDFANKLRDDLFEKTVDLQASGAGGGKVATSVTFRSQDPDVTSTHFKFKYAVSLDEPYKYRVRELLKDGREIISDWKEVSMWSGLLDVTTRNN